MKLVTAALLGIAPVLPADAALIYANNFDAENSGTGALNYNGFTGLTVTGGSVDLVGASFGITCSPAGGLCVDLDGSTGDSGVLGSSSSFAFGANQTVRLSFALSGSQRSGIDDTVALLRLGSSQFLSSTGYTHNGAFIQTGSATTDTLTLPISTADVAAFGRFTLFFTSSEAGEVKFEFSTTSNDNVGAVLDDLALTVSDAVTPVPEPKAWAMLIAGFGLIGAASRRRQRKKSYA